MKNHTFVKNRSMTPSSLRDPFLRALAGNEAKDNAFVTILPPLPFSRAPW